MNASQSRREYAYSILSLRVRYIYAKTVWETNTQLLSHYTDYPAQYQHAQLDTRGSTNHLKFLFTANLLTNFATLEYVTVRKQNGYIKQQFNRSHLVQFNKADSPDTPIRTSTEFLSVEMLELPLVFANETSEPPFKDLFLLQARLITIEDGRIGALFFTDQFKGEVRSSEEIDLSLYKPFSSDNDATAEEANSSNNPFRWSGNNTGDENSAQSQTDSG